MKVVLSQGIILIVELEVGRMMVDADHVIFAMLLIVLLGLELRMTVGLFQGRSVMLIILMLMVGCGCFMMVDDVVVIM